MKEVSAKRLPAPIKLQVNGHSFVLTLEQATSLRDSLSGILRGHHETDSLTRLLQLCAHHFNVPLEKLKKSGGREQCVAHPRQAFMWLAYHAAVSYRSIARFMEMDHGTMMHGVEVTQNRIDKEPRWKITMADLYQAAERDADVRMLVPAKGL